VDIHRKLAEDPLVSIKRKEIDNRRKIMENPIKMKQLREYVRIINLFFVEHASFTC
jgi:hypothetical protein